jgi:hypothetical protein
VYQDVPTTPENMRQRIIDGCAAMNPQVMNDQGSHYPTIATLH